MNCILVEFFRLAEKADGRVRLCFFFILFMCIDLWNDFADKIFHIHRRPSLPASCWISSRGCQQQIGFIARFQANTVQQRQRGMYKFDIFSLSMTLLLINFIWRCQCKWIMITNAGKKTNEQKNTFYSMPETKKMNAILVRTTPHSKIHSKAAAWQ